MKLKLLKLFLASYPSSKKISYSQAEVKGNQFLLFVVYKNGNSLSLQGSNIFVLLKIFIRLQKTINTSFIVN